jgi:3-hydroxyisobutyrate dehydrogenase-like beta-hydroxyacid dehydrogenase
MTIKTIGLMSPGEMGGGVGWALHEAGFDVVTCLEGRGEFTRKRAEGFGLRFVDTLETLLAESDLVLSILPPEYAPALAERIAGVMKSSGHTPPYADFNAVSPGTSKAMQKVIEAAGAVYIDGGIVGSPPNRAQQPTRIFVSGPTAETLDALNCAQIDIRQCGPEIGRGSAVKMVYAGITKGTSALHAALLLAAEKLGVVDELHEELAYSLPPLYKRMENMTPGLPATAGRFQGEMREIALTMDGVGVTPDFHTGSLWVYEVLDQTPFASEIRETVDKSRTLRETIRVAADYVPLKDAAE